MRAAILPVALAARRAEQGAKPIDQGRTEAGKAIAVERRQLSAEIITQEPPVALEGGPIEAAGYEHQDCPRECFQPPIWGVPSVI
jgi:hypothetical protein